MIRVTSGAVAVIHLPNISGWGWFAVSILGVFVTMRIVEILLSRLPKRFDLAAHVLGVVILFVLFWQALGLLEINSARLTPKWRFLGLLLFVQFQFMLADFIDKRRSLNQRGLKVVQEGAVLQFSLPSGQIVSVNSGEFTNDTISNSKLFEDFHEWSRTKGKVRGLLDRPTLLAYLKAKAPSSSVGVSTRANEIASIARKQRTTASRPERGSQGVRRLGITLGGLGSLPGAALIFLDINNGADVTDGVTLLIVGFIFPYSIVHIVHWIVRGFAADRERKRDEPKLQTVESAAPQSLQSVSQGLEELKSAATDAEMDLLAKALRGDVAAQWELGCRYRWRDDT
jgi:hypothetical protein